MEEAIQNTPVARPECAAIIWASRFFQLRRKPCAHVQAIGQSHCPQNAWPAVYLTRAAFSRQVDSAGKHIPPLEQLQYMRSIEKQINKEGIQTQRRNVI